MEIWSWNFVDKNASDKWKQASRESYLRVFGMGGMFEQDDLENWAGITHALQGPIARRLMLQYGKGLGESEKNRPVPALKDLVDGGLNEDSERAFYRYWQRLMMRTGEVKSD